MGADFGWFGLQIHVKTMCRTQLPQWFDVQTDMFYFGERLNVSSVSADETRK